MTDARQEMFEQQVQNLKKKFLDDIARNHLLFIFPTETLWGLAAVANDSLAVEKIFLLKERDHGKPLTVMLSDTTLVEKVAAPTIEQKIWLERLRADSQLLGKLTVILPYDRVKLSGWDIAPAVLGSARLDQVGSNSTASIGIRVPYHPWPRHELLPLIEKKFNAPLAVTSVNFSGQPPATTMAMVKSFIQQARQMSVGITSGAGAFFSRQGDNHPDDMGSIILQHWLMNSTKLKETATPQALHDSYGAQDEQEIGKRKAHVALANLLPVFRYCMAGQ
ncbi:MAG: Sua5/YciO/YrdC/YwlC family protein [Alphaproteobacteria bacterium]|nr:Sua5/YciO/YrdC/YwlC family protein [Alphaproteobacteria bacterium]